MCPVAIGVRRQGAWVDDYAVSAHGCQGFSCTTSSPVCPTPPTGYGLPRAKTGGPAEPGRRRGRAG